MDRKDEHPTTSTQVVDRTHYDLAQTLIKQVETDTASYDIVRQFHAHVAAVHAQLAQVDAIEALTAVLAGMEFPALEVSGSVIKGTCRIRPVER